MLIVQKYGGSSVADTARILHAAGRIAEAYRQGNKVAVVLSAQGSYTDELLAKAAELYPAANKRELDALLSTGEQQSVALMSIALNGLGCPSVSLNASQAGISATSVYGNARIKSIDKERLQNELERNNIVIVTGFQGINRLGDVVTIGRGGSDTTAVALAVTLNADICEIYTDVDGVYTADPRIVKNARKLREISYDDMLELASAGANVLHNRAVEMAKRYKARLVVRGSFTDAPGTLVREGTKVEKLYVSGISVDKNTASVSVLDINRRPGDAYRVFSLLAKENISVGIVTQSSGKERTDSISFTVARQELPRVMELLTENRTDIGYGALESDANTAKISVVGAGMESTPGVASMVFEAVYDIGVNIKMISTSEIKISILVDEKDADIVANAVHDRFLPNFN